MKTVKQTKGVQGVNISGGSFLKGERWCIAQVSVNPKYNYVVSDFGRFGKMVGHGEDLKVQIMTGSNTKGFKYVNTTDVSGKGKRELVHRMIAESFVEKPSSDHKYVVHKDHNLSNNNAWNLEWVDRKGLNDHQKANPKRINMPHQPVFGNAKLTEKEVRMIKRLLLNPDVKLYKLAKRFGITHTQLNRIRSGENWSHITLENE